MGLIKSSQEKNGITLNNVLLNEYDLTRMDTIEYS